MLTSIRLEGFKAISDWQEVDLAPITLIFGANSSGKSSILQALLLLKQSYQATRAVEGPIFQGSSVDLGSFRNTSNLNQGFGMIISVSRANVSLLDDVTVTWYFTGGERGSVRTESIEYAFGATKVFTFERPERPDRHMERARARWDSEIRRRIHPDQEISQDEIFPLDFAEYFAADVDIDLRSESPEVLLLRSPMDIAADSRDQIPVSQVRGPLKAYAAIPGLLSSPLLPLEIIAEDGSMYHLPPSSGDHEITTRLFVPAHGIEAKLASASDLFAELAGLVHIGPVREIPPRVHTRPTTPISAMQLDDLGYLRVLSEDFRTRATVNSWLSKLGINYSVSVESLEASESTAAVGEIQAFLLRDKSTGIHSSASDVGFGVSQVLPVVVQAALAEPGRPVLIEQPEIHLHPATQAQLMDLFIDRATAPIQNELIQSLYRERGWDPRVLLPQFILETHSEHMILRLQKAIRLGRISPDLVSVLHVEKGDNGGSTVRRLRLNERGEFLDEWPGGFFDERIEELFGE